jgi:uncharacterized membrane protein
MVMKIPFETTQIEARIRAFEENTGHELIVAAAPSSDPYPGAAWRGGLLLGLMAAGVALYYWELHPRSLEVLLVGAMALVMVALLRATSLHHFFVLASEADRETLEKSVQLFHGFRQEELGHQAALLLYFSMWERKLHLLVDGELKGKLSQEDLDGVVASIQSDFHKKDFAGGLTRGVTQLEELVLIKVGKRPQSAGNHVPDKVFWLGVARP